jgi:hypothetical protein
MQARKASKSHSERHVCYTRSTIFGTENMFPIIMISSLPTALIMMYNVKRFLQESRPFFHIFILRVSAYKILTLSIQLRTFEHCA